MNVPVIEKELGKYGARLITYKGKTLSVSQWAEKLGISSVQLLSRIRTKPAGEWFKPLKRNDTMYLTIGNVTKSVKEWSEATGVPTSTMFIRIAKGLSVEEVISTKGLSYKTLQKINGRPAAIAKIDEVVETTDELDKDLELKRQIAYWRGKGLDDDEIYIKLRKAA